jgi:hypothetical protein
MYLTYRYINKLSRILHCDQLVNWLTPRRLRLYPPLIPIMVFMTWTVSLFLGKGLMDLSGTIVGSDFLSFYAAGKIYLNHDIDFLYDFKTQYLIQQGIVSPADLKGFYPFINPPLAALFFSIFSHTSYIFGLILWWLMGLLLVVWVVCLFKNNFSSLRDNRPKNLFYYFLLFPPTLLWFTFGQNTAISLVLYVLFFMSLRRSNEFLAGIFWGLLLFKPQLCLSPGLIVLLNFRWKALGGALVAAFSSLVVTGLIIGLKPLSSFIKIMPYLSEIIRLKPNMNSLQQVFGITNYEYPTWGLCSLFGFWSLLLDSLSPQIANTLYLSTLTTVVAYLFIVSRKTGWQPGTKSWDLRMAGSLSLGLILTPHLFSYDLMLLVLPIVLVWNCYPSETTQRPLDGGLILFWTALLYVASFLSPTFTLMQLKLTSFLNLSPFAFQGVTLVILFWSLAVLSASQFETAACNK